MSSTHRFINKDNSTSIEDEKISGRFDVMGRLINGVAARFYRRKRPGRLFDQMRTNDSSEFWGVIIPRSRLVEKGDLSMKYGTLCIH